MEKDNFNNLTCTVWCDLGAVYRIEFEDTKGNTLGVDMTSQSLDRFLAGISEWKKDAQPGEIHQTTFDPFEEGVDDIIDEEY